ncbi:MAG: ABC transporter ATP-binding protein [Spirochaetales bacterium]|uniref:ABC transporter ATP-binding protein n=1 Tax=Candidatus Thalassospirochaeta sargassi TaxID=3119039 RepID=A0AAJ1IFB1_9SPIO|nr:ABC transporter ATP-binding protein [Spirochaetales bacterium]
MSNNILDIKEIFKVYPDGVIANRNVSMDVQENSIHALVGENGAGKSTLMKVLFGITPYQGGSIEYKGSEVKFSNPREAIAAGIGMVHQHLMLAPDLTVAENLILGMEPLRGKLFLDADEAVRICREASEKYGLAVPAEKKIRDLPIGVRQRVEILKALARNAEVLILDEPTAVLTPQETDVLFKTLDGLKAAGKTIIFITHKLSEVTRVADRITVMRDAQAIITRDMDDLDEVKIASLMVGRKINTERIPAPVKIGSVKLSVRDLKYTNSDGVEALKGIDLDVRSGEILGLAGVEGNGQTELVEIIAGLMAPDSGSVTIDGTSVLSLTPRQIREAGLAHIPEDRMENGVAEVASVEENLIVDRYYKPEYNTRGRLYWKLITEKSKELIKKFNILTKSSKTNVGSLSGGNIQKVVVARELTSNPGVIIAAQPTRGVDIGSEELIHNLLKQARDEGKAVFLISADLDEVLKLSNRVVVFYDGEITAHFKDASKVEDVDLGPYMLGIKKEDAASGKMDS